MSQRPAIDTVTLGIARYGEQYPFVVVIEAVDLPRLTYNGDPLGIPHTSTAVGEDGPTDAARALNNVRTLVADFRTGEAQPPQAFFGNPAPDSPQSGVGIVSGWAWDAAEVLIEFALADGQTFRYPAALGTVRTDTEPICGDSDNGFGLL